MVTPKITRVSKVVKVGGEYVVKAWVGADGKTRYPDGDYYTTDRQDALDTAARMVRGQPSPDECDSDPGTGQVYTCHSVTCPKHGRRNVQIAQDQAHSDRMNAAMGYSR